MNIDQSTIDALYSNEATPVEADTLLGGAPPQKIDEESKQPPGQSAQTALSHIENSIDEFGYEIKPSEPTGNPYSLDPDSVEDKLYGAESGIKLDRHLDLSVIYGDEESQTALRSNLGFIAAETGASQSDVTEAVLQANRLILTGHTHDREATLTSLYELHGESLHNKLDDAQELIASFPDLAEWLDRTGIGNDETFIQKIIEISSKPRAQNRLRKLRSKT